MSREEKCYAQLDEMHKLVDSLRAELEQYKAAIAELKKIIDNHHVEIFEDSIQKE